jgi:hypothetical protein
MAGSFDCLQLLNTVPFLIIEQSLRARFCFNRVLRVFFFGTALLVETIKADSWINLIRLDNQLVLDHPEGTAFIPGAKRK